VKGPRESPDIRGNEKRRKSVVLLPYQTCERRRAVPSPQKSDTAYKGNKVALRAPDAGKKEKSFFVKEKGASFRKKRGEKGFLSD